MAIGALPHPPVPSARLAPATQPESLSNARAFPADLPPPMNASLAFTDPATPGPDPWVGSPADEVSSRAAADAAAATVPASPETPASPWLIGEPPSWGPDWKRTQDLLGWAWNLHVFGFACLFFMLAFYTFFSILNLRAQLSSRPFMSTINIFLCMLGMARAGSFLIDPYNSKQILPEALGAIAWELGLPCLLSAFGLVQLAFLQLTQLRLGPAKLRSKSCLSLIISAHFFLTIASSILWTFHDDLKVVCFLIQAVFSCWGIFLCTTFLYGGWRTMQLLKLIPPILFPHLDLSTPGCENKGILQLGILAKCNNLASVAATVAAPALIMPPKIRITDENEQTHSYVSETYQSTNTTVDSQDIDDKVPANNPAPRPHVPDGETTEDSGVERSPVREQPARAMADPDGVRRANKPPRRVRIDSLPSIIQQNGTVFTLDREAEGAKVDDDQVETGLLQGERDCARTKGAKCQDLTLSSILNHIAYVDQAMDDYKFDSRRLKPTRRSQIQKVLRATCLTALLGLLLCLGQLFNIFGPYGLAARYVKPSPLPWFIFQTFSRTAEFLMGCVMANITKQPVNRHHFPYSYHLHPRDNFYY